jgi:hypothetical protein
MIVAPAKVSIFPGFKEIVIRNAFMWSGMQVIGYVHTYAGCTTLGMHISPVF